MKQWIAALPVVAVLATGAACQKPPAPAADTILINGHIVTVDRDFRIVEAMAIADGKVTAVGSTREIKDIARPETRTIDLRGRTVVPGLADNHLHSAGGGPGVDLSRARSLADVLAAIARRVSETPRGGVIVTNSDWHEAQLKEQRLPLRRDLDRVAPQHPVVVVRGGHEYILNSVALAKWKITQRTPEPAGGRITKYPDGTLNGELVDQAKALVKLDPPPVRSLDERIRDLQAEHDRLLRSGLTSIRYPGIQPEQYKALQEMQRRGGLRMRVNALLRPTRDADAAGVRAFLEQAGIRPDEGDEWLRVGGVKLGVDGGFEGGLMREPYAEPWGQSQKFLGLQTVPTDRYIEVVREVNRLGWRVATHAVGDAAIDLVLTAYERANADKSIVGKRWVIEHGFIPRLDQFPRMKQLGLEVSAQDHLYLAGPSLVHYWGQERAFWTTPAKAYLDNGIPISFGTDSPVIPYNPFWVIYHFVTRNTITGGVMGEEQRISREDALRLSTVANARLNFEEAVKGSLEPGKVADLLVLPADLLSCSEKDLEAMTPLMTMVGGRVAFEDPALGEKTTGVTSSR